MRTLNKTKFPTEMDYVFAYRLDCSHTLYSRKIDQLWHKFSSQDSAKEAGAENNTKASSQVQRAIIAIQ